MADHTQDQVTVTARKFHTLHGEAHHEGETYVVDADQVDNLVAQGMVSAPEMAPGPVKASKPVTPITTHDIKGTH